MDDQMLAESTKTIYKNKVVFKKAESPKDEGVRGYTVECMGDDAEETMKRAVRLKNQAESEATRG